VSRDAKEEVRKNVVAPRYDGTDTYGFNPRIGAFFHLRTPLNPTHLSHERDDQRHLPTPAYPSDHLSPLVSRLLRLHIQII